MRIAKDHPYWHIQRLVQVYDIENLFFSYYHYRPQSLEDERYTFSLARSEVLNIDFISDVIHNCPDASELAIHSTVLMSNGQEMHIPMIDMSTSSKAHIYRLRSFIGDTLFDQFSWYASGRSFHGYGGAILSKDDWGTLMGFLLLSNQKNLAPTVDPRWIGHRLVAGYSALRWTKNTKFYISIPRQI